MVPNMNMLQSLDVEIHFWERLSPTSGRKMGIIGLSEILVSSSPQQQCDKFSLRTCRKGDSVSNLSQK